MANAHENIDNEIVANSLQEILHTSRGESMDLLYKLLTKSGEERFIHRNVQGLPTDERREGQYHNLRRQIELDPTFADTLSYKEGKERLAPQESISSKLLKALGIYEEGGEVEEVNWAEILKEKGLDMETVGALNKAIGRNLESWEMYKDLFNPESYSDQRIDYFGEDPAKTLSHRLGQAEFYKQYLQDYPKSNPQGQTDVRFGTLPSGGWGTAHLYREKEKEKGLMALLQRLLPGGKTGYKRKE
tara:strand:- start:51 stop:785 length:735 start_codon:yes stop_codon:yes gene_type:complete